MQHLKIRRIGNSLGVVLPKDLLAQLGVGEGDELVVTSAPERGLRLTRGEADLERQLEAARKGMERYHNALRELAK
jgi:putative addiction module antidote